MESEIEQLKREIERVERQVNYYTNRPHWQDSKKMVTQYRKILADMNYRLNLLQMKYIG